MIEESPGDPPHALAFPAFSGEVFTLTDDLVREGCEAARHSPRKRIIYPIHRRPEALVQRMLNFMQPGTYVRPHCHPLPDAIETVQVLRGELGFLIFDGDGVVKSAHRLTAGTAASLLDIEPGTWHGMAVLAPDTVLLEIKRGPYDPRTDKTFADWAPDEDDKAAPERIAEWVARFES